MCVKIKFPQGHCCLRMRNELGGKFNFREKETESHWQGNVLGTRGKKNEEVLFNILLSLLFGLSESAAQRCLQGPESIRTGVVLFLWEDNMLVCSWELFPGAVGTPCVVGWASRGGGGCLPPSLPHLDCAGPRTLRSRPGPFWCQINQVRLCLREGKRLGKAVWKPRELQMREVGMRAGMVTYKRTPFTPLYARKMSTARGGADHCPQTLAGGSRHDIRDQQGWDLYP